MKLFAPVVLAFCASSAAVAQSAGQARAEVEPPSGASGGIAHFGHRVAALANTVLDALTLERGTHKLALYPAASYSGRQGLAVGLMPLLQFGGVDGKPGTTVTLCGLYSTKKMYELQSDFDIFPSRNQHIQGKLEHLYLPDRLYAPGNDAGKEAIARMDIRQTTLQAKYLFTIGRFTLGPCLEFQRFGHGNLSLPWGDTPQNCADSVNAECARKLLADADGARWAGGLTLRRETRDNVLYPRGGGVAEVSWLVSRGFSRLSLDARRFMPAGGGVVAAQIYLCGVAGRAPYTQRATFAGSHLARAIDHNLKYYDRVAWLARAEWRRDLFWRVGGALFAGAGNASCKIGKALTDGAHLMAGVGLRFKVFRDSGLNLRLDAGLSHRGDKAVYFNVREAF